MMANSSKSQLAKWRRIPANLDSPPFSDALGEGTRVNVSGREMNTGFQRLRVGWQNVGAAWVKKVPLAAGWPLGCC